MDRILVVDDEPQVLVALEDQLSEEFEVVTAAGPEQALSAVADQPELAVVISDQRMPGMNGDELLARVQHETRAMRMLLTGYADLEAVTRAVNRGHIFAYLAKPWNENDLLSTVRRAAGHFRLSRELDLERRLLRDLMDSIPDAIYFKDEHLRFIRANPAFLERMGKDASALLGRRLSDIVDRMSAITVEHEEAQLLAGGAPLLDRDRAEHVGQRLCWFSESKAPVRGPEGKVIGVVGISREITLRKQDEERLARLTNIRTLLSEINAAIVRTQDHDELLQQACRIAVAANALPLAAIARIDPETAHTQFIASEPPNPPVVEALKARLADGRHDSPLLRQLLTTRESTVINDIAAATQLRYRDLMLGGGLHSAAILPLMNGGEVDSVFCLFSSQVGFFDREELKLLREVTDNLSHALEHIGKTERLNFLAYHDELTRAPNRELLLERTEQQVNASRQAGTSFALLILDIDRFRQVNDSLGRASGDTLLRQVADRLCQVVGDRGTVARVFSNTFGILLPRFETESGVASLIENELLPALNAGASVNGIEIAIAARIGIAVFPADGDSAATLLSNAEAATKKAKVSGQPYLFYAPSINARVAEKMELETQLRRACKRDEFLLHYQPKVDLRTGRTIGLEALIRWQHADGSLVPPGRFIPLLEETGLIREVGRWVLFRAAQQHQEWQKAGLHPPRIAVNVSAMQLSAQDFGSSLEGIDGSALELEITESVFVEDLEGSIAKLEKERRNGFTIAMDDFGTGYSSLSALERLPLNSLKVDQSFVRRMMDSAQSTSIVTTIISLAHALDLSVVAEGVETLEQARLLRLLKCDSAQGYLIARPLPVAQISPMLEMSYDVIAGSTKSS